MASKKPKKFFTPQLLKKLEKYQLVIFFVLVLSVIGFIQAITWVYDRFFEPTFNQYQFEENIFNKLSPGNTKAYLISSLGEPQKVIETEIGSNLLLWSFKDLVVGVMLDKDQQKIDLLAAYSTNCNFKIVVPQQNFILCQDKFIEPTEGVSWVSFLGAQNIGYIEDQITDRSTKYLSNYYGGDLHTFELVQKAEEIYGGTDEIHNLMAEDKNSEEIRKFRKDIIPNFIAQSDSAIPIDRILWDVFTAMSNFGQYNLP